MKNDATGAERPQEYIRIQPFVLRHDHDTVDHVAWEVRRGLDYLERGDKKTETAAIDAARIAAAALGLGELEVRHQPAGTFGECFRF